MTRSVIKISDLNRCPPPNYNPCYPPHCPPPQCPTNCNPCCQPQCPPINCNPCCQPQCPPINCNPCCPPNCNPCGQSCPPHLTNYNNNNYCSDSSSDSSSDDDSSCPDKHKKQKKKHCANGACLNSDLYSSKSSKSSSKWSDKSSDKSSCKKDNKNKKEKKHKKKCRKCNSSKCKCIKYYNSYETDCGWVGLCISPATTNPNTTITIRNIGTAYITNMSIYTSYNNCIQPINKCLPPCGTTTETLPIPPNTTSPITTYYVIVYVQVGKCKYVYSNTLCITPTTTSG